MNVLKTTVLELMKNIGVRKIGQQMMILHETI
jgi:hypothetical protein